MPRQKVNGACKWYHQEVHDEDGYIVKEVNKYEKSYEHCFVTCDHCKAEFKGPYLI